MVWFGGSAKRILAWNEGIAAIHWLWSGGWVYIAWELGVVPGGSALRLAVYSRVPCCYLCLSFSPGGNWQELTCTWAFGPVAAGSIVYT